MIKLRRNFQLPDHIATMKMGLLGRTGSGKTNTSIVMAEQMIDAEIPIVILDPQGDWWGIRTKYPIAIFGGDNGDAPLDPDSGSFAADFVVNERIPVLLDLFGMDELQMVRFATDFAKRLWHKNRQAVHVFLDEADLFAPQKPGGGQKVKCLSAWQNVARRGRSRGLGLTMVTQRSAVINKDLFTQADPVIVHRLTAPQDIRPVADYLEFHGLDLETRKQLLKQIPKLDVGEAIVISPGEMQIEPAIVKVQQRKSFDSSATPKPGQKMRQPKFATVDMAAIASSMEQTIERAKATDPKLLQQEVARLKRELAAEQKRRPAADPDAIRKAVEANDRKWIAKMAANKTHLLKASELLGKIAFAPGQVLGKIPDKQPPKVRQHSMPAKPTRVAAATTPDLGAGEAKVLRCIAQFPGCDRTQVTIMTGYKRSSRDTYIQRLRSKGFVNRDLLEVTDDGEAALGNFEPLPTGDELRSWWMQKLSGGELRIFQTLEENAPLTRDEISELTGYKRSSRDTYIQRLNQRKLLRIAGSRIALSDHLFD